MNKNGTMNKGNKTQNKFGSSPNINSTPDLKRKNFERKFR